MPEIDLIGAFVVGLLGGVHCVGMCGGIGGALSIFPIGGVAVLVGLAMYLPFSITLAYGIGCLVAMGLERAKGPRFIGSKLVPLSAGLIVGEALTQLLLTLNDLVWSSL